MSKKRVDNVKAKAFMHSFKNGQEIVFVCLETDRPPYVGFPAKSSNDPTEIPVGDIIAQLFIKDPELVFLVSVAHLENISLVTSLKICRESWPVDAPTPTALFRTEFKYPAGNLSFKAEGQNVLLLINDQVVRTLGERLPLSIEFGSILNTESQFCVRNLPGFNLESVIAAFTSAENARTLGIGGTNWAAKANQLMSHTAAAAPASVPTMVPTMVPTSVPTPVSAVPTSVPTVPSMVVPQVASIPSVPSAPPKSVKSDAEKIAKDWVIPQSKTLPTNFLSMTPAKQEKWLAKNATRKQHSVA